MTGSTSSSATSTHTRWQVILLVATLMPEVLLDYGVVPLYPYLIENLLGSADDIGSKVGMLTSAFYMPLLIMNVVWGVVGDRFSKKLVLILGLLGCLVGSLLLGFSQSYSLVFISRLLAGFFGSNSTIIKGYIGDVCLDERSRSWAYSIYGSSFGIGGLVGPLLAGRIVFPAKLYSFSPAWKTFFTLYPFSIPCMISACLSLASLYIVIFMLDKSPNSSQAEVYKRVDDEMDGTTSSGNHEVIFEAGGFGQNNQGNLPPLTTTAEAQTLIPTFEYSWKAMGPILLYVTLAFVGMVYNTLLPLFIALPVKKGGLGLQTSQASSYFATMAISNFFVSITNLCDVFIVFMGSSQRAFGITMISYIPTLILLSLLPAGSDTSFSATIYTFLVLSLIGALEAEAFQSVILMITQSQHILNLGKAHGISTSLAAISRSISPAVTGYLFDWSVELKWIWMTFLFGGIVAIFGGISAL